MADIKTIAATYAARIFDRMELCRGSAILKSDIEREVEAALNEYSAEAFKLKPGGIFPVPDGLYPPPPDERYVVDKELHSYRGKSVKSAGAPKFTPAPGYRFWNEGGVLHHERDPDASRFDTLPIADLVYKRLKEVPSGVPIRDMAITFMMQMGMNPREGELFQRMLAHVRKIVTTWPGPGVITHDGLPDDDRNRAWVLVEDANS